MPLAQLYVTLYALPRCSSIPDFGATLPIYILFRPYRDVGSELLYKLGVNGLENPTMSHIHVAETLGGKGPSVQWLYPDTRPPLYEVEKQLFPFLLLKLAR